MKTPRRIIVCGTGVLCALLMAAAGARAGDYYVYACSSYGNAAPAFAAYSNADHLSTANDCLQPAPGGGYRSLEINNPPNAYAPVAKGYGANWTAYSPSPAISIVGAYTPVNTVLVDCNLHSDGFTAEFLWSGGTQAINHVNGCDSSGVGFGTGISSSFAPSSYFGWGAGCWLLSSCSTSSNIGAVLGVQGIRLTAEENSGPSVAAQDGSNIWWWGGRWVRGGGWSVSFSASDPSGVCATDLLVNGQFTGTDNTQDGNQDTSSFTQCWPTDTVTGSLDSDSFANGPLTVEYAARNAANVVTGPSQTLQVDNTPVKLALSTPNDPDPNVWVNHPVLVMAAASAGPSGVAGTDCTTNNGTGYAYPATGIHLNGTGVWKVSCVSQNNSYDVNNLPASSPTETATVHIDETPPTVAFEPVNPSDPQLVVAGTSDGQSGIASGQIQMRPAGGGSWQSLPTSFDGAHLLARFDDSTLAPGSWVIQATSCDNAGNCASTHEPLTLPVRTPSVTSVSFEQVRDAVSARRVTRRVLVGWHWSTERRNGKSRRVKQGGQLRTVTIINTTHRCSRRRVKTGRGRWREKAICRTPRIVLQSQKRAGFGQPAVLHGLLTTEGGLPLPGAPIEIQTAPDNGLSEYTMVASATTNADGAWAITLGAGPSRLISASYGGAPTVQPSRGAAALSVPASVKVLEVWPRHIPWGGRVHIKAQLLGGYLPAGGALVRLRLGYGSAKITYGVQEHVAGDGIFEVTNTFGPGPFGLVRRYWLQECTLPEGDYPFAPACGPRSGVLVGGSNRSDPRSAGRVRQDCTNRGTHCRVCGRPRLMPSGIP